LHGDLPLLACPDLPELKLAGVGSSNISTGVLRRSTSILVAKHIVIIKVSIQL
jgi:hypothetical protein